VPPASFSRAYDEAAGRFVPRAEYSIETSGSNLLDVLANPYVDATRTRTNDVVEACDVLGIEAARLLLFQELQRVVQTGDVNDVNYRHLALLVDVMTNRGHLVSIDRHGINKGDIGPLAKCSFEETGVMLVRAGLFCEHDDVNGVSANIMLGQVPPCGTGEGQVLMDTDAIAALPAASAWTEAYRAAAAAAAAATGVASGSSMASASASASAVRSVAGPRAALHLPTIPEEGAGAPLAAREADDIVIV